MKRSMILLKALGDINDQYLNYESEERKKKTIHLLLHKIFTKNFLKSLDTDLRMCYNKYIKKGHLLVIGRC